MASASYLLLMGIFLLSLSTSRGWRAEEDVLGPSQNVFEDCHWVCGKYGVFMECGFDEVVVGACGAKSWANCENRQYCPGQNNIYAAIKCCKMNVFIDDSEGTT